MLLWDRFCFVMSEFAPLSFCTALQTFYMFPQNFTLCWGAEPTRGSLLIQRSHNTVITVASQSAPCSGVCCRAEIIITAAHCTLSVCLTLSVTSRCCSHCLVTELQLFLRLHLDRLFKILLVWRRFLEENPSEQKHVSVRIGLFFHSVPGSSGKSGLRTGTFGALRLKQEPGVPQKVPGKNVSYDVELWEPSCLLLLRGQNKMLRMCIMFGLNLG